MQPDPVAVSASESNSIAAATALQTNTNPAVVEEATNFLLAVMRRTTQNIV